MFCFVGLERVREIERRPCLNDRSNMCVNYAATLKSHADEKRNFRFFIDFELFLWHRRGAMMFFSISRLVIEIPKGQRMVNDATQVFVGSAKSKFFGSEVIL